MRLFLAFMLSPEIQSYLGEIQEQLKEGFPKTKVRWVRPEMLHLTIRFFGDCSEAQLAELREVVPELTTHLLPASYELDRVSVFPRPERPQTIWVGLKGDVEQLLQFKSQLNRYLKSFSWEEERLPFVPHVSLGRVTHWPAGQRFSWPRAVAHPLAFSELALVKSESTPKGPVYKVIHAFKGKS